MLYIYILYKTAAYVLSYKSLLLVSLRKIDVHVLSGVYDTVHDIYRNDLLSVRNIRISVLKGLASLSSAFSRHYDSVYK